MVQRTRLAFVSWCWSGLGNRRVIVDALDEAVEAVLPGPLSHSTVVWYYTSPSVAESIIDSEELWATSIATTNDASELWYGMQVARDFWNAEAERSSNRELISRWMDLAELALEGERRSDSYILCASLEGGSITQWERYGVCTFGIKSEQMFTKEPAGADAGGRISPTFTTGWRRVLYTTEEQTAHLCKLFKVLDELCSARQEESNQFRGEVETAGIECILRSIVYLKSEAFASEAEVRLYGQAVTTGAKVFEHTGKFGPSTHIKVIVGPGGQSLPQLPMVSIRVPQVNPGASDIADRLDEILASKKLSIRVERVPTPFRMAAS